ncbi:MAG TPA: hypothetical protein DCS23_00175 [Candidatus Yonathbacteria bacterium]|nr:hypothetical protein [Candidatus Yonathbacteria bacterium]
MSGFFVFVKRVDQKKWLNKPYGTLISFSSLISGKFLSLVFATFLDSNSIARLTNEAFGELLLFEKLSFFDIPVLTNFS